MQLGTASPGVILPDISARDVSRPESYTELMKFLDPRGQRSGPSDPYEMSATLEGGQQIGLFANGFPGSVEFLEHVGAAVQKVIPHITVKLWNKGNASALASPEDLAEISDTCSAVIAAYGH